MRLIGRVVVLAALLVFSVLAVYRLSFLTTGWNYISAFNIPATAGGQRSIYSVLDETCHDIFHHGKHVRDEWVPRDCDLHKYSRSDVRTCMNRKVKVTGNTHLAFVGDSRVRETFLHLASYFDPRIGISSGHSDQTFTFEHNVTLELIFTKWMNGTHASVYETWLTTDVGHGRPELIVSGTAAWMIWLYDPGKPRTVAFERYVREFRDLILPLFQQLESAGTRVIWKLQDPVIASKLKQHFKQLLFVPENLEPYNTAALEILNGSGVNIWHTSREIALHWTHELDDGLHYIGHKNCKDQHVQILLNYICNQFMDFPPTTCCSHRSI